MRLKLTLRRADAPVDLAVTADATATVADVARMLRIADPRSAGSPRDDAPVTLRVSDPFQGGGATRTLEAESILGDASLLSGSTVELVTDSRAYRAGDGASVPAVAQVRVLAGPDAGREFLIPAGTSVIGRDRGVDIRLSDPMVSKRHARINAAGTIEILDLGSANGVVVDGDTVGRATLSSSDTVVLGDTTLCVLRLQHSVESPAPQVEHVRSPRVVAEYPGGEFPAPVPPKPTQRQKFPYLALVTPLIMGGVMWAVSQEVLGAIMMAMSPVLLVVGHVDQSFTQRRERAAQRKAFDASMLRMQERMEDLRQQEARARVAELPTLSDLQDAVRRLGPLLWSERVELPGYLTVSSGRGRLASRNRVELPAAQDTLPEYWDQLLGLQEEFRWISDVPVPVDLRESGALGIAGAAGELGDVARAAVFQLIARHSPAELIITAVVGTDSRPEWDWVKWLPHTGSSHSPVEGAHLADSRGAAGGLLAQLEGLIQARHDEAPRLRGRLGEQTRIGDERPFVPTVVLLVTDDAPADRARLTSIAERGPDAGVHVVWCAPRVEDLPAACRSFISVDAVAGAGTTGNVRSGEKVTPVTVERLDAATADQLARLLAPVVDAGVPEADESDLPRSVSYPALAGEELLDSPSAVVERWRQNNSITVRDGSPPVARKKEGNLRAVIGHAGSEPFTLDLRTDGPHALVGGTTGAGKSEFLQSWVLGMAAAHSPDRLTFLFVDYKGGSAFADCVDLPHTVGLVTDLSPHLVRRALTSLRAELRHREHVLVEKKAKDLITLEKTGDPDCPPSLVIVVDEFAALVQEVPEFVDGVVDVAQRGRSLGLHLVLATQRPAGVIRDNLRANTNLRIALRMADVDDSVDILGDKMAAYFDPSIPGRGAAKTGPGRLRAFQTGYVGGRTTGEPPKPRIDVRELDFGGDTEWEAPPAPQQADQGPAGPTDIARIVSTVTRAATDIGIPAPRRPWLEELAPIYNFEKLPNPRTDERLPLGVLDQPASQSQPTVFYEPDRDGNLAIFGTGGSGKSTALRTIAIAAAATTRRGGPTHVYGFDFGSRGLSMLEDLPHVGAIVSGDDDERIVRTIRMLRDIVDERAARYAAVSAGSIGEYRERANAPQEPRIILLVDGIGVFKERYEFGSASDSAWFTAFAQICADGRGVGVHVVLAGDRPNALPTSIASTVQRRIVLRLAHEDEYMMLGVPKDILSPTSPPGRGILDDNEVQVAILGESGNVALQAREIQRLRASLSRGSVSRATAIARLEDQVWLEGLPNGTPEAPVIGIDDVTLGAATMPSRGAFLVAGTSGGGRTTALVTIGAAARRADPGVRTVLLSPRRTAIGSRGWTERHEGASAVAAAARTLTAQIERGEGRWVIVIESLPEFTGTEAELDLDALIRMAVREEQLVVGEGESSTWSNAYQLAQPFRAGRSGLLLVPGEMDGDNLLSTSLGRIRRADFPPGRGFVVTGGRARKVQVAQDAG